MADWTLTVKLPGGETQTESFTGEFGWCDARDAIVDGYLDDQNPKHQPICTMLCDGDPDETVCIKIDGILVTLLPSTPRYQTYSVDNGTGAVVDTKHDLEVALCNRFLVENPEDPENFDQVEVDNGHDRANFVAFGLNLLDVDLPGADELAAADLAQEAA